MQGSEVVLQSPTVAQVTFGLPENVALTQNLLRRSDVQSLSKVQNRTSSFETFLLYREIGNRLELQQNGESWHELQ